ncbi:MAG: F0F1 ATP synthase subunit B, partial [Lacibacter sp.]
MNLLTPGLGLLVWTLVAFLVVFFLLKKYAWPAIIKGLTERENGIAEALETAEKVKAEMAQMKNENEALLAKAREERAQLLKEARETRDKIVSEAKDLAKTEANKIIVEAQAAINQQKLAALTDVKNQVGNLVIEVSEKVLRRELANKADQ